MCTSPSIRVVSLFATAATLAVAATAAYGAARGGERFTLTGSTIHGVDKPIRLTAAGPVTGTGIAVDKDNPDGKSGTLTFRLPKGTVVLTNRATSLVAHPNVRACLAKIVERGTFRIVRGTAAFVGVHGSGTYVRNSKILGARDAQGTCLGRKSSPAAVYDVVTMTGNVTIG